MLRRWSVYVAARFLSFALLVLPFAVACSPVAATPDPGDPIVVLVSLDGFRVDYLEHRRTPTLSRLARNGVRAKSMRPSFPSLTFPNHYTLVTGVDPDRHGIVHNRMFDPKLGQFSMHDRRAVQTGGWWGAEPIWVTAHKAGMKTASMFWVGSEAPVAGIQPDDWHAYDESIDYDERVAHVLAWLGRPHETRPRMITLYFEGIDKAGHDHGPNDAQIDRALVEVDRALAKLVRGVRAMNLAHQVNFVIVSDHGMIPSSSQRVVLLDEIVDPRTIRVVSSGQVVTLFPAPGREAEVERKLLGRHAHFECWRKGEVPKRFRYGTHPRIPPIVCLADEEWIVATRDELRKRKKPLSVGSHGYDPDSPRMAALFVANGPAFRRHAVIERIEARDVYNVLAAVLRLTPAANDGDPSMVARVLAPR